MILSRKYLLSLIKKGKAEANGIVTCCLREKKFMIVTRFDIQRTDHYELKERNS